jgi:hypothetical protein
MEVRYVFGLWILVTIADIYVTDVYFNYISARKPCNRSST